jgi:rubrerythrin
VEKEDQLAAKVCGSKTGPGDSSMEGGAEEALICEICGVQFGPGQNPQVCPICTDERQFLPR